MLSKWFVTNLSVGGSPDVGTKFVKIDCMKLKQRQVMASLHIYKMFWTK